MNGVGGGLKNKKKEDVDGENLQTSPNRVRNDDLSRATHSPSPNVTHPKICEKQGKR